VFIVPALLSSVLAIAGKGWLLLRRVKRRRADAAFAVKERRGRKQMRAALHMLLERFVLQHEEHVYKDGRSFRDNGFLKKFPCPKRTAHLLSRDKLSSKFLIKVFIEGEYGESPFYG